MKTQTVFKIVIMPDEARAAIHTKCFGFMQIQDIDADIRKLMKAKKEKYFYGYINNKGELRIETEIVPKDW